MSLQRKGKFCLSLRNLHFFTSYVKKSRKNTEQNRHKIFGKQIIILISATCRHMNNGAEFLIHTKRLILMQGILSSCLINLSPKPHSIHKPLYCHDVNFYIVLRTLLFRLYFFLVRLLASNLIKIFSIKRTYHESLITAREIFMDTSIQITDFHWTNTSRMSIKTSSAGYKSALQGYDEIMQINSCQPINQSTNQSIITIPTISSPSNYQSYQLATPASQPDLNIAHTTCSPRGYVPYLVISRRPSNAFHLNK